MKQDLACAEALFQEYVRRFGEKLRVEFHPTSLTHDFDRKTKSFVPYCAHCLTGDNDQQKAYNLFLLDMCEKYSVKGIIALDAHFIDKSDKLVQDVLLQAGDKDGWRMHSSYHAHTNSETYAMLKAHLGERLTDELFNNWLANSKEIVEQAKTIDIKYNYHLPKIEIPPDIAQEEPDYDKQTFKLLMRKIKAHGRWRDEPAYVERFKQELKVIMKNPVLNFIPYFLIYEDLASHVRSKGILQNVCRGSAGGSLISYYLKIIHIDPVKENLPFERFLSNARIRAGSFPDIDLDLSDRARPIVITYLREKYGLGFAQIGTFTKLKTKNAIKDAARALYAKNGNDPDIRAVCDSIPDSPQGVDELKFLYGYTDKEDTYHPGQVEINSTLSSFFKTYPKIEKLVRRLVGIPRGWSRHASAFVISTLDLPHQRVPTMLVPDERLGSIPVTQYDAPMVESCGLVKADILGIKTLSVVEDCAALVKNRHGLDLLQEVRGAPLIYQLPEDPEVYQAFQKGDTDSSFQFNSDLIKQYIGKFKPAKRKDLADLTALCRPGALDAPLEDTTAAKYYIEVRNGDRPLSFLHEDLRPILEKHNGVYIYQESVMQFLVDIVGYSWEEADTIRSAIAKKKLNIIQNTFKRIRESCTARGWSNLAIETICKQIEAFSRYSFNLSHSRGYAELGYVTMWLKQHYDLEWWCAVLNNHLDDEDKLRLFVRKLHNYIKPPSLLHFSDKFIITEDGFLQSPIQVVKGAGKVAVQEMALKAPFTSFDDFINRIDHRKCNSGTFKALLASNTLNDMAPANLSTTDAKKWLANRYIELRNKNTKLKFEDISYINPIQEFLALRDSNIVHSTTLLDDSKIIEYIKTCWPAVSIQDSHSYPLKFKGLSILKDIETATNLINTTEGKKAGMFLLFKSSTIKTGISKTGRPWRLLKVSMSDGLNDIEGMMWNAERPLGFAKNSLIFVSGLFKRGWRDRIEVMLDEIQEVYSITEETKKIVGDN
jgi:DNA polymerase-3 subunit alpha